MSNETASARPMIALIVRLFVLFAIVGALAVAKETGAVDPMLAKRGVAIGIGLMMMVTANQLPKLWPPAFIRGNGPFTRVSPERFAGWTFMLSGVVYVAILATAPIDVAMPLAAAVGLIAFAIAGFNWAGAVLGGSAAVHVEDQTFRQPGFQNGNFVGFDTTKRLALLNLFFAFFWAFAIFLADSIWGDEVSRSMAIVFIFVFVVGNALLRRAFVNLGAGKLPPRT